MTEVGEANTGWYVVPTIPLQQCKNLQPEMAVCYCEVSYRCCVSINILWHNR